MTPRLPPPSAGPWLGMWPLAGPPSPALLQQTVTLKVTGGRALRMRAMLLAECGFQPAGALAWHEASLYRREDGGIVLALRSCRVLPGIPDIFRAEIFAGPDQAMHWIAAFDPLQDLPPEAAAWRMGARLLAEWRLLADRLQSELVRIS